MTKEIRWETELGKALERSKVEKKVVFLDFYNPN